MKPDIAAARKALAEMFPDLPTNIPEDQYRDLVLLHSMQKYDKAMTLFDLELQKYGKELRDQKLALTRLLEAVDRLSLSFDRVLKTKEHGNA